MTDAYRLAHPPVLRDLSNHMSHMDLKDRNGLAQIQKPDILSARRAYGARISAGRSSVDSARSSVNDSPQMDRKHANNRMQVPQYAQDIYDTLLQLERKPHFARNANYLQNQSEINEKMRTILIDWMVDVHLKFKLHPETFFLAVDVVDRYLSQSKGQRSTLQLVGITAVLLAAKYEEIWPPEVRDCVHISANTYTSDEVISMERSIVEVLQFRLSSPTAYPFLTRLLEVTEADSAVNNTAQFYLEHAAMDYKCLQFTHSQIANACMYLANLTLHRDGWNNTLQYYSKSQIADFRACAQTILAFANQVKTVGKFQAVRRKYGNVKYGEVARLAFPELPTMYAHEM